jgi:hypothetical protein
VSDEPTYADLIAHEETMREEERRHREQYEQAMARLNKRIIVAMQREGIR